MTAGDATTLVDVAQESRWRRWSIDGAATPMEWREAPGGDALAVGGGAALRVATLDAQAGLLEHPTRRATLAAGVEVALAITSGDQRPFGERAQALRDAAPDVVLVPLADHAGADRLTLLAEALRFACVAQRPRPRVLLACADERAVARGSLLLSPFAVEVLPDIRNEDGHRRVVDRLREARRERGVLRDEVLEAIARAIAHAQGGPALVVDVTGGSTSLVRSDPAGALIAVHARPLGIGRGADLVVARGGLERVRRWIPWSVDQPTLLERVFNRARWPDAVPAERETLALDIALAHEAIGHALADAAAAGIGAQIRSARAIFLTGRLAGLPGAAAPVLIAIDALGPTDAASIGKDDGEAILAIAAAALASGSTDALAPRIAERAIPLAAVVPVAGSRRATVRILVGTEVRDEAVQPGSFFLVPVQGEVDAAAPGIAPARLAAGAIGVIVDARRRPLALPIRDAERVPTVASWYDAVGATPVAAVAG